MPLNLKPSMQTPKPVFTAKDFENRIEKSYLFDQHEYGSTKDVSNYIRSFAQQINNIAPIKPELNNPGNQINPYLLFRFDCNRFASVELVCIQQRFLKHFLPILQSKQYPDLLLVQLPQKYLEEYYESSDNYSITTNNLLYQFDSEYLHQETVLLSETLLPLYQLIDSNPVYQHELFSCLANPQKFVPIASCPEEMPLLIKSLKEQNFYSSTNTDKNDLLFFNLNVIGLLSYQTLA